MDFKVIVTLGPAILNNDRLEAIHASGPCIFRINGAHSDILAVRSIIAQVRSILPAAEILLDLPGNKIRTANLDNPIQVSRGAAFELYSYQCNFADFFKHIKAKDLVLANDSELQFEVKKVSRDKIIFLSYSDGLLQNNKGLHLKGVNNKLPFILEKDRQLIKLACDLGLDYISASFVRNAADLRELKGLISSADHGGIGIVSKIEIADALKNIEDILDEVDSVLIDRGDLYADIGISDFSYCLDRIIKRARVRKKKIYLATQFLKNMIKKPLPLIAEMNDVYHTINKRVNGIQLSEETAIGRYPVECVKYIFDSYKSSRLNGKITRKAG